VLPVLDAAQMREADRRTISELGIPGTELMEKAGQAVAAEVRRRWPQARKVAVLCGRGNNGGDGFVAARALQDRWPSVYLAGRRADVKGDARVHLDMLERAGGNVIELPDPDAWDDVRETVLEADVIVDALLGTGLAQSPSGVAGAIVHDLEQSDIRRVLAVDLPSGISSDGGEVGWSTVRAAVTVTFAAPKHGHVLWPASERCGDVIVADIGIPREVLADTGPALFLLEERDAARAWPPRRAASHKGDFGHVLVVGGAAGKSGAAILAATAALRVGAGLVTAAVPAPSLPIVAAARAELMTEALYVDDSGNLERGVADRVLSLAASRDAIVLGPGLGAEAGAGHMVRELVGGLPVPAVLDADALNALAPAPGEKLGRLAGGSATVLTPHPGEMARLMGTSTPDVQRRRLEAARELATTTGTIVVLKGHRTVIAHPDGRAAVNPTGNPGMAKGGTGDVLAGMVGALLARGVDPFDAACAAVYLHGRAGDLAAESLGQESMLAGDLLDALPRALKSVVS
jgi:hydroxyethylthiazole kinase-like uncharacterized protein yjeF